MSIIIADMIENDAVVIYGDERVVRTKRSITTSDDFVKVVRLTDKLACGITGEGFWQEKLLSTLNDMHFYPPSILILVIKSCLFEKKDSGNIILGGLYDNGRPFLWQLKINGSDQLLENNNATLISTDGQQFKKECADRLLHLNKSIKKGKANAV